MPVNMYKHIPTHRDNSVAPDGPSRCEFPNRRAEYPAHKARMCVGCDQRIDVPAWGFFTEDVCMDCACR